jgi:hypothetical protein
LAVAIAAAMRTHGLADPQVQIRRVERIDRHHGSGKLKRFIAMR